MYRYRNIIIFGLLFFAAAKAQMIPGEWRTHLPYSQGRMVVEAGDRIYCSTEGGLFYLDRRDNSLGKITKVDGLAETKISTLNYHENRDILLIAYRNANIDLLSGKDIYNIPDIKIKQIPGDKSINHVLFLEDDAYLSCGFGIVVLNLPGKEIKDTYYIGEQGSSVRVNAMTFDGRFLYAATIRGIYRADINNPNLIDYRNWSRIDNIPNADKNFNTLVYFNDRVFVNYSHQGSPEDTVYYLEDGQWQRFDGVPDTRIRYLGNTHGKLVVVSLYHTDVFGASGNRIRHFFTEKPRMALIDGHDVIWIADYENGLIKNEQTWYREEIHPNGPLSTNAASMSLAGGKLYVAGGGVNSAWNNLYNNAELFTFSGGEWSSYRETSVKDLIDIAIDPSMSDHVFVATWGYGLLEFTGGEMVERYDHTNSTLQTIIPGDYFYRLGGVAFDKQNNLWVTNSDVPEPVSVRKPDGTWHAMSFNNQLQVPAIGRIIVTKDDHKWLILPKGNGLFVFDDQDTPENSSDDEFRRFDVVDENGRVISNQVFSIAEDLSGNIWVGTDKGIVVYYNPPGVFTDETFSGRQVIVPRNDETGLADILLGTETVTAIAVDGADRKWIGTMKAGVFLVSDDGREQVHHFTAANSPLLSDRIYDIAIDHRTGEVFLGTGGGIISYKGRAIRGNEFFRDVYAYPNPVREDFEGDIIITGLVRDVNVKITDINGNMVFETRALGGQAVWDGCNFSGEKVSTGVYLIFCTNDDGSKTHVTKLLVVN